MSVPSSVPSCPRRGPPIAFLCLVVATGCGDISCPEPLTQVDGVCEKVDRGPQPVPVPELSEKTERCDGLDNDGDDAIDEDWPELGQPCGEHRGECMQGHYVCSEDAGSVVCEGAVGPTAEVCDGLDNDCNGIPDDGPDETCDGLDNDCDGLIDEGVWAVKQRELADHSSVAAIDDGFVVTRVTGSELVIETYDLSGEPTGHSDEVTLPYADLDFVESDAVGSRLLVLFGGRRFHLVEAHVDSSRIPIIVEQREVHEDWRQGIDFGVFRPPLQPRISAVPARIVGYRDLITFALTPATNDGFDGLMAAPTPTEPIPADARFDATGPVVVWEEAENLRAGSLLDDGEFLFRIDVARGTHPALAMRSGGPGLVFLQNGRVLLSELGGFSLQCLEHGFCSADVGAPPIPVTHGTTLGLAYEDQRDAWIVAASDALMVVGRSDDGAVLMQSQTSTIGAVAPTRIDAATSGGTAAIVQSIENGASLLTFMGCF